MPMIRQAAQVVRSGRLLAAVVSSGLAVTSAGRADEAACDLASDEMIVFLTTAARPTEDLQSWIVPIHAWVYEPETTRIRKAAFAATLRAKYGLRATDQTQANFDRRAALFALDNEEGKELVVEVAGRTFALPETAANGRTFLEVELDADSVARVREDDALTITAVMPAGDARSFTGRVNLIGREGISVISDIDDTVKITEIASRTTMLDRTFFRDFEAVPGMADQYSSWARQGAALHFVSSSPWQMYEPLDEFLDGAGFPPRSLSLKQVRLKDRSLWDLFKEGTSTKPLQIRPILEAWPLRRFVLVGDTGERDPEVYAALGKQYPGQIERIYLRNVDNSMPTDDRYRSLFADIDPAVWQLFTDPADLTLPTSAR